MELVVSCLSRDLLREEYADQPDNPLYGHCFHACEALFDLLGGYAAGYRVRRGIDDRGIKHYWLVREDGQILDPTAGQYTSLGRVPPYAKGKGTAFRNISNSAKLLLARVEAKRGGMGRV
jgi:hypothetical protein